VSALRLAANAKVNLTLDILGRREEIDGERVGRDDADVRKPGQHFAGEDRGELPVHLVRNDLPGPRREADRERSQARPDLDDALGRSESGRVDDGVEHGGRREEVLPARTLRDDRVLREE